MRILKHSQPRGRANRLGPLVATTPAPDPTFALTDAGEMVAPQEDIFPGCLEGLVQSVVPISFVMGDNTTPEGGRRNRLRLSEVVQHT